MARQQANKGDKGGLVSRSSMERIGRAVAAYERGDRNRKPQDMPRGWDDKPRLFVWSKTTAFWGKNTEQCLDAYDGSSGESPNVPKKFTPAKQIDAWNLFGPVPDDRWVVLVKGPGGVYYLLAAEC